MYEAYGPGWQIEDRVVRLRPHFRSSRTWGIPCVKSEFCDVKERGGGVLVLTCVCVCESQTARTNVQQTAHLYEEAGRVAYAQARDVHGLQAALA